MILSNNLQAWRLGSRVYGLGLRDKAPPADPIKQAEQAFKKVNLLLRSATKELSRGDNSAPVMSLDWPERWEYLAIDYAQGVRIKADTGEAFGAIRIKAHYDRGGHIDYHYHPDAHELIYVRDGYLMETVTEVKLKAGEAMLIDKSVAHETLAPNGAMIDVYFSESREKLIKILAHNYGILTKE